jgi:triacylglycerol lipase
VVPTLSQLKGELLTCAKADHLDVLGHFHDPSRIPPHFDWISTGTGFHRADFEAVWRDVLRFIARAT